MCVAGRVLNIEGKDRDYGEPVPEANTWPPHIRRAHIDTGAILDVDNVLQMKMMEITRKGQRESAINRARNVAEKAKSDFDSTVKRAKQLDEDASTLWKLAEKLKVESEKCLAEARKIEEDLSGVDPLQSPGNVGEAASKTASPKSHQKAKVAA